MQSPTERLGNEAIAALAAIRSVLQSFEAAANEIIAEIQQSEADGQTQLVVVENKLEVPNG